MKGITVWQPERKEPVELSLRPLRARSGSGAVAIQSLRESGPGYRFHPAGRVVLWGDPATVIG